VNSETVAADAPSRIAIIGTVGVPGRYGGFETLAENLVGWHAVHAPALGLAVYCSKRGSTSQPSRYKESELRWIGLDANGPQSIIYEFVSLLDAVRRGDRHLLILGVSGAMILPLVRLVSRARIITNIDGIEWRRAKWRGLAKWVLRLSEWFAVRFSHTVIADNQAIADYVTRRYGRDSHVIPYGGDHALMHAADGAAPAGLPGRYALALCRIEPENNVDMILEAWRSVESLPLVFVGNWAASAYGRELKARYAAVPGITLVDPVYEPGALRAIRDRAALYVHGHSAGGTNPSLVEMMHFAIPVLAHGCSFNRHSTEGRALYFQSAGDIVAAVDAMDADMSGHVGAAMAEIADRRYRWDDIAARYFALLQD
jgi:glycosyltransferase involved in cell wall biosynthesis